MCVSYAVKEVNKWLCVFLFSIYVDCIITIFTFESTTLREKKS